MLSKHVCRLFSQFYLVTLKAQKWHTSPLKAITVIIKLIKDSPGWVPNDSHKIKKKWRKSILNIHTHLYTANYKQYNTRIEKSMDTLMCWCQRHLFLLPPQLLLLAGRVVVWAGALELCWTSKWSLVKLCTLSGWINMNTVNPYMFSQPQFYYRFVLFCFNLC